jgi:hypothetical protein
VLLWGDFDVRLYHYGLVWRDLASQLDAGQLEEIAAAVGKRTVSGGAFGLRYLWSGAGMIYVVVELIPSAGGACTTPADGATYKSSGEKTRTARVR